MALNFQKITLVIAAIILVIVLIIIGISMSKGQSSMAWPPVVGNCPDYWVDLPPGSGQACFNEHFLGNDPRYIPEVGLVEECDGGICKKVIKIQNKNTMDFNTTTYTGSLGDCNKSEWAKKIGVTWDGITYGVPNPCDSTETS
jgi:hypothetical protein